MCFPALLILWHLPTPKVPDYYELHCDLALCLYGKYANCYCNAKMYVYI